VRRNKEKPLFENVLITDVAAEGKALARVNDKVLFVPFAVPGDVVNVQVTRKRTSYMEGYITEYVKLSPIRQEPFCEHFGTCGGCKWQFLPYAEQLNFKQKQVEDQLVRIGKLTLPAISPILGSENTTHYRNKLEYTFSNRRWIKKDESREEGLAKDTRALGFHIPGMFDKILDIHTCYLQPEPSNSIRLAAREWAINSEADFYDNRSHQGLLRNLIIRTSETGEVMVIVVFAYNHEEHIQGLLNHLSQKFPSITSLQYVINPKLNDTINDLDVIVFKGKDHMMEKMEDLFFKVGPKSFYQTNSKQAYRLYSVARKFAALTGNEIVYDLYTGTGTIANFIAHHAKKVIGIEYVPEAIEDAVENSKINGITNTKFFAGDMKNILQPGFMKQHGYPEVVILDPPRAGIHADVAENILLARPLRIVYVSCNPATQARDLALLSESYKVTAVQPVDMFPHTHHVENVVKLERIEK
jgi:23S rRNA (uracil-5-)-methyltransferase RumA